ncbi:MAG TPA: hypothetical protein PLN06_09760 [Bacteroidales bacterium]|nr:hypothetical protein [Bacteroidales bacterium]HRU33571.1 hypothetical protein [Candidatus Paceibacterota bacterium]
MENKGLRIDISKPLKLEPNQEWICNYLDHLNEKGGICSDGVLPSDLIRGALAAVRNAESNPDWMAQSAHSYREVLYRLGGTKNKSFYFKCKIKLSSWLSKLGVKKNGSGNKIINSQTKKEKIGSVLQVLHEQKKAYEIANILYKTHLAFTKICHHFAEKKSREDTIKIFKELNINVDEKTFPSARDYNNLILVFENTLKASSLDPLKIHEKIDLFIKEDNNDASYLRLLFSLTYDAKRYFFSQANDTHIDWLWQNNFLDGINNKSEDLTHISDRLPELDYLTRMAEKNPTKVTNIMLNKSTATREDNFNPEVVNRFLRIITTLPAEQIKLITSKIRDERWIYAMRAFRKSGYEFDRIVKKLVEAKESDAILELAQAILIVKSKAEVSKNKTGFISMDDPFYVSDLDDSGIFEALANISDPYKEKALQITTSILAEIVKLAEPDEARVFDYTDLFALYDVDMFTLEIEDKRSYSYQKDIINLTATIKKLIESTFGKKCTNIDEARRMFGYIDSIPSCHSVWRLRFFALVQCPETFKKELKDAFFKLFSVENYYEVEGGTEYKKALKIAFPFLSDTDRHEYVNNVISYFFQKAQTDPDKAWIKHTGWEILSSIPQDLLTEDEKVYCKEFFGHRPDQKYEPEPPVKMGKAGFVNHRSPVNLDDFTIDQIIENLKSNWIPEKLNEQFKNDDFLNPRSVEGLGDAIKENVKKRTNEYLNKINLFFERNLIHSSYVYSLLRGIEEMLRNKQTLGISQITQLLKFFKKIEDSGKDKAFRRKEDNSWLADWIDVHKVATDILLFILEDKEKREEIFKQHRELLKNLISYLFTIKDSPTKEYEKPEYGELYHIAINSVRGRAYEAFVVFTEGDGKNLADDVKTLYKQVLKDDSLAVRFVVGRYLASFYFRDKDFITGLLPEIFPKDEIDKKDIYLASWEGYLSNTLYDQLFVALSGYYEHAINLDPQIYTERKYSKDLDESLAIHIALAFAHLGLEFDNQLFIKFWSTPNIKRHQEFVSFIGRSCLTRDQAGDKWLEDNKVSKDKLIKFWGWALENISEPEVLAGFGFWINPDKEVLDEQVVIEKIALTLKKSNGNLDWDYGLMKRLPIFANKNSRRTLEIISNFLLDSNGNLNSNRRVPMFDLDNEIKQSLEVIYNNGNASERQKVIDLINSLIDKGSDMFWGLKNVINGNRNEN